MGYAEDWFLNCFIAFVVVLNLSVVEYTMWCHCAWCGIFGGRGKWGFLRGKSCL